MKRLVVVGIVLGLMLSMFAAFAGLAGEARAQAPRHRRQGTASQAPCAEASSHASRTRHVVKKVAQARARSAEHQTSLVTATPPAVAVTASGSGEAAQECGAPVANTHRASDIDQDIGRGRRNKPGACTGATLTAVYFGRSRDPKPDPRNPKKR